MLLSELLKLHEAATPLPINAANVLAAMPGPPGDLLMALKYPDSAYSDKKIMKALWDVLDQLEADGKIAGRSRTADDPWFDLTQKGKNASK